MEAASNEKLKVRMIWSGPFIYDIFSILLPFTSCSSDEVAFNRH
jgi:hypothetical protein